MIVLIPAIPFMILVWTAFHDLEASMAAGLVVAVSLVLLPRAVKAGHTLWISAPTGRPWLKSAGLALVAVFLGSLFAGFLFTISMGFLGLSVRPPNVDLGVVFLEMMSIMRVISPLGVLYPAMVVWGCAFAFYTAADAMVGYFNSKQPMSRFDG